MPDGVLVDNMELRLSYVVKIVTLRRAYMPAMNWEAVKTVSNEGRMGSDRPVR
jgi:hypothetical protein